LVVVCKLNFNSTDSLYIDFDITPTLHKFDLDLNF